MAQVGRRSADWWSPAELVLPGTTSLEPQAAGPWTHKPGGKLQSHYLKQNYITLQDRDEKPHGGSKMFQLSSLDRMTSYRDQIPSTPALPPTALPG